MPYGDTDLSNIDSGKWHPAIIWTNVNLLSVKSSNINLRAISQEIPQPSLTKISLNITYLDFHLELPGVIELTYDGCFVLMAKTK